MPFVVWPRTIASNAICEMTPETVDPEPNGFPADNNAAFREQVLDVTGAHRKAMIGPDRVGDNFARETETFEVR